MASTKLIKAKPTTVNPAPQLAPIAAPLINPAAQQGTNTILAPNPAPQQVSNTAPSASPPIHNNLLGAFQYEWPHVRKAPRSFVLCLLVISFFLTIGIYWFIDHCYAATIAGMQGALIEKESTIQKLTIIKDSLTQEIGRHSKRTEDSAPSSDEWKPLTDEQVSEWVTKLTPYKLSSLEVVFSSELECHKLVRSLEKVAAGLQCQFYAGMGNSGVKPFIGAEIIASINDDSGESIGKLFGELKIPVKEDKAEIGKDPYVRIYIGPKR